MMRPATVLPCPEPKGPEGRGPQARLGKEGRPKRPMNAYLLWLQVTGPSSLLLPPPQAEGQRKREGGPVGQAGGGVGDEGDEGDEGDSHLP